MIAPGKPGEEDLRVRLRVISFNIHGGRPKLGLANLSATAQVLRELSPDLAGLQEVHRWMPPPYVFAPQPSRLDELLELEVRFQGSFGIGPMAYGLAVVSCVTPDLVHEVSLPGHGEPRSLMDVRLTLGGQRVHFLNTHLGLTQGQRQEQVRRIADRIEKYRDPVVLTGDLNSSPGSEEMHVLESSGLTDAASAEVLTFPCESPETRLDYILVSRHFRVETAFAHETEVSDHLPLVADLELLEWAGRPRMAD